MHPILPYHLYPQNLASEAEQRLLFRNSNAEREREEALAEFEGKEVPIRERIQAGVDSVLDEREAEGKDRINQARRRFFSLPPFSKKKAVEREMDALAQERVNEAGRRLEESGIGALEQIHSNTNKSKRSLQILTGKEQICKDYIRALDEETNRLKSLREEYRGMGKLLGRAIGKMRVPDLKRIETERKRIEQILQETRETIRELESTLDKEVCQFDENLRTFLVNADPEIATELDELILENAAGNPTPIYQRIKAMRKAGHIDKTEDQLFRDMAERLRGGRIRLWSRKKEQKDTVNSYYQRQNMLKVQKDINEPSTGKRLQRLSELPIGQRIQINIAGSAGQWAVASRPVEGRYINIINQGTGFRGVIDLQGERGGYYMTMRTSPGAGGAVQHLRLGAPATRDRGGNLIPEYRDPTRMYLSATPAGTRSRAA